MHMVNKRNLTSDEVETMRISKNTTTVMTASGEVQTRREATVYVEELHLFVTVMLLEETPAVLSLGRIMGKPTTGPAVKNHFSPKMARELIAIKRTTYHSLFWFIDEFFYFIFTRFFDIFIAEHGESSNRKSETMSEGSQGKPSKPKTEMKMKTTKNYEVNHCKICRNGYRIAWRIWWIRMFNHINTLPALLMYYQWSREQEVVPGLGKHSIYTPFPKDRKWDICLRTKIARASCRRRAGTVVPRADNFGDLMTADQKILSEGSESRNNHRYAVVVQDLATQWFQSYPCKTKTSQETQKI